ncbi:SCO family protein [Natronococcus sp. A-GB1]|uniref:SCO family protein n=1 Tax=Natronococcus sp. A-GB1 TaxID=3037648 RepID=UPI00241DE11E|nr:SCO family protein [Natronococcus sp. A-GB1]MDG5760890.1 SCO family protein [Natronococcus sp. A-GB1]
MKRRAYLGTLGVAGMGGLAGCLGDLPVVGNSETALGEPEQSRGNPSHPAYGDEFPTFTLPDPHAGREVSLEEFEDERAYLLTFIYTSCPDQCGVLTNLLGLVQEDAAEEGYEDDVAMLAMTFDPETDDADALREYGEQYGVDYEAENWHFLRPETEDEAMELLNEEIGVPAQVGGNGHDDHGEGDHDGHGGDDHDDHDDHDHDASIHYYIVFLVNEQGIVERSYPNVTDDREENRPQAIIDDVRTVVE